MGQRRSHKKILNDNRARNNASTAQIIAPREMVDPLRERNKPFHAWQGRFERGHKDSDPVIINRYSPYRDIACQTCEVPYGTVGVATAVDGVVSFEFRVDSNDASCYHRKTQSRANRTPWNRYVEEFGERDAARKIARERAREDRTAAILQASLEACGI